MTLKPALLAAVAATLLGGCGDQLGTAHGPDLLRGAVHYVGGPASVVDPGTNQPGVVHLIRDGDVVAQQALHRGEEFGFRVEPGAYTVSTNLGDFDCERDVRVDRAAVHADLVCQIK
jgi:hypothetical protein